MKRGIAILLALACGLSLFGCKKSAEPAPTTAPTDAPTEVTQAPTETAATQTETVAETTQMPTQVPTEVPTDVPTQMPTQGETEAPTQAPTEAVTTASATASMQAPVTTPTQVSTTTQAPTAAPTQTTAATTTQATVPTNAPVVTLTSTPVTVPTIAPTVTTQKPVTVVTATQAPITVSTKPTQAPITTPTQMPTQGETEVPTQAPTEAVTTAATTEPAQVPITIPTQAPTVATTAETTEPVQLPATTPIQAPTTMPTSAPTTVPTQLPVIVPTLAPVTVPTRVPVLVPTMAPVTVTTQAPTTAPTQTVTVATATQAPTTVATTAPTQAPTQAPTEHVHTFGEWILQALSSCTVPGREDRRCACGYTESRDLPLEPHKVNEQNVCKTCLKVTFDDSASLVELGVVTDTWYGSGADANFVWDLKYWNGKVYRAAGDYDKNSGATTIVAYDIARQKWEKTGTAADEAVHGFVEISGTLVAPGVDAREGWEYGNFYVLQGDGKWQKVRNLPNGVHNFDMIELDGKIFAGLGTETTGKTVAMSEDGGQSFTFVPLYKDGSLMDLSGYKSSRTYEFVKYNGTVYALVRFALGIGGEWAVFRYEDGKMHYQANGFDLLGTSTSRKYFGGEFEFNGACYIAGGGLTVVTDFSDPTSWKKIPMPGGETVIDAFLDNGTIYVLATVQNRNPHTHNVDSYKTVIYKSTTGQEGSFEEVLRFDYCATPMSFDWDGEHFYIGTGVSVDKSKVGMVLRATPEK